MFSLASLVITLAMNPLDTTNHSSPQKRFSVVSDTTSPTTAPLGSTFSSFSFSSLWGNASRRSSMSDAVSPTSSLGSQFNFGTGTDAAASATSLSSFSPPGSESNQSSYPFSSLPRTIKMRAITIPRMMSQTSATMDHQPQHPLLMQSQQSEQNIKMPPLRRTSLKSTTTLFTGVSVEELLLHSI